MPTYLLIGGAGYLGTKLTEHLLSKGSTVYVFDLNHSALRNSDRVISVIGDVRLPISTGFIKHPIDWIFNFAAIHREPGHLAHEYFETNIKGANHVCDLADKIGCANIFFTSSISTYGPTLSATSEDTLTMPNTPYGISKLTAEYIHKVWAEKNASRKLIIVRPGVIYGPGDPGNILRMIRAVKRGYFLLPVTPSIKKSYGYVYGLLESFDFMTQLPDNVIVYNYVEKETESLGDLIKIINQTLGFKGVIIRFPLWILKIAATILHKINPNLNGIHPERVKKVARPTHIVPKVLAEKGFVFQYNFQSSLLHWKNQSPTDF